jgi:hypothetical protein
MVSEAKDRDPLTATKEQERLAAELQHLRDLLERDQVEEARRFVKELEQRWPEAERVRHYAHVLAPPKVRSRPDIPPRSMDREWQWLQEHRHEYPGCWLAVYEDRLIASDPDRRVVIAKARQALGDKRALLFFQPVRPQPE